MLYLFLSMSFLEATSGFQPAFRVKAGDAYISVDAAHSAPVYEDLDGDGVKELLVGQFAQGRIRLYKNYGTNTEPIFKDFTWLEAGEQEVCLSGG